MMTSTCRLGLVFAGWAVTAMVLAGCGKDPDADKPVCHLIDLLTQTSGEVDGALGSPTEVLPVTRNKSQMPGEFREYTLADGSFVQTRFHKGLAVAFTVTLKEGSKSPDVALRRVDVDPTSLEVLDKTATLKSWRGELAGLTLDRIEVQTPPDDVSRWNKVVVEVRE